MACGLPGMCTQVKITKASGKPTAYSCQDFWYSVGLSWFSSWGLTFNLYGPHNYRGAKMKCWKLL